MVTIYIYVLLFQRVQYTLLIILFGELFGMGIKHWLCRSRTVQALRFKSTFIPIDYARVQFLHRLFWLRTRGI